MYHTVLRLRLLAATFAGLLLCGLLAACSPFAVNPPTPTGSTTPFATQFVLQPTATPEQATEVVPVYLPPSASVYPSPDGALLAAEYGSTITLYTPAGQEVGSPRSGVNVWGWLPDSSGIFITQGASPMLIMDRQGTLHATGLNIIYPELSQDGRWIGGTAETRSGAISGAVIAPRSGGAERVLAPGGEFLGWQNNRAVYTNGGYGSQLYALDPNTSAPILLGKLTSDESPELPRGEINSPDGQVLSLQLGRSEPMMLVGNQLLPLRNFGPWVGLTHDVMVIAPESDGSYSDYVIEDGPTGKVVRDTGVSSFYTGGVMAISGDWMVTSNGGTGQFLQLSLVNFDTKVSYTIDPTLSDIVPLGNSGEFLSVDTTNVTTNSNAREPTLQILIIDPALMR